MKLKLPTVTIVAISDGGIGKTVEALLKTLALIEPKRAILFSDVRVDRPEFECIEIKTLGSTEAYSHWVVKNLVSHLEYESNGHVLIIQHDGYVLHPEAWTDEFLQYDYIGAPWLYRDGRNVGNGGFSLRSIRLQYTIAQDHGIEITHPEDEIISRLYRSYLEKIYNLKFAPEELAHRFSYEMHPPRHKTFGFHGHHHFPYREPIILKRSGAMGDVIMMEPVMEWFDQHGYRVILDCPRNYHDLFQRHPYSVEHVSKIYDPYELVCNYRRIDLDMAYEIKPQQLALKSYFEACGIKDYKLRNAQLQCNLGSTKLFRKYVVMHINKTDMPHRNIAPFGWYKLARQIEERGFTVVEIGNSNELPPSYEICAENQFMLAYIIGGADFFIGSDSGPAQVAVASGVPAAIFFGSVNPAFRYHSMDKIYTIQAPCPIQKDGCYHSVVGTRGVDCEVSKNIPPCTHVPTHETIDFILAQLP